MAWARRGALLALVLLFGGLVAGCGFHRDAASPDLARGAVSADRDTDTSEAAATDDTVESDDSFATDDPSDTSSADTDTGDTEEEPSDDPVEAPETKANRAELIEAAKQLEATGSAKITGGGSVSPGGEEVELTAEGVVDFRTGDASFTQAIGGSEVEIRTVDGVTYMKGPSQPGDKPWISLPSGTGVNASMQQPSSTVKRSTRDTVITKGPGPQIDGSATTVYEAADPDIPDTTTRFFVDSAGRLVRVEEASSQEVGGSTVENVSGTTFSELGAPVHVEAPPPDQVQDFDETFDSAFSDDS